MKNKTEYYIAAVLLFALSITISANGATDIRGKVTDEKSSPLPYVNVYILNTVEGAMTNEDGEFRFRTAQKGTVKIIASLIGYAKSETEINLDGRKEVDLEITLEQKAVELDEAVVMGSSFGSEKSKGLVISNIDVYTTPGGAADLFQSIKTMPGVTNVSESAELYVRGGNPIETVTMIDQASVYHPYTYESSYGGLFSNLNTSAMKSMYFSSGGFSVKYGNVLSGVLDIETKSEPATTRFGVGISMAAASLSAEVPIAGENFGIRIYGRKSYTEALMRANGGLDEFTAAPTSEDLTSIFSFKYSNTGRIKITGVSASDKQGVKVARADYSGTFDGNSSNNFINLQQKDILFDAAVIKNSVSFNKFNNSWKIGGLDLDKIDRVFKARSDFEAILSGRLKLSAGGEYERRSQEFIGKIPEYDYDIGPEGDIYSLNSVISGSRIGGYAEITLNHFLTDNLHFIGGLRTDYFPELNEQTIDPRFGLMYKYNSTTTLKAGWGIFHQSPDMRLFVPRDGNPNLKSMRAVHYSLSFDKSFAKNNSLRIELYYKDYASLPLENETLHYTNDGYGYAYGTDIILKGKLPLNLEGWISYGYLNTKRKWMNYSELTRSDYDITHGLTLILKYNISVMWQAGINFKYSTGRPYTPIIDSEKAGYRDLYKPIYGAVNSSEYPDYKRLDLRITHFDRLFGNYFTVFYLEALNILNVNNLFEYTYSFDYKIKKPVRSYFGRRTLVFGISVSF